MILGHLDARLAWNNHLVCSLHHPTRRWINLVCCDSSDRTSALTTANFDYRRKSAAVGDQTSTPTTHEVGVTQGSRPGPIVSALHSIPVISVTARHRINLAQCADDTILFVAFSTGIDDCFRPDEQELILSLPVKVRSHSHSHTRARSQ